MEIKNVRELTQKLKSTPIAQKAGSVLKTVGRETKEISHEVGQGAVSLWEAAKKNGKRTVGIATATAATLGGLGVAAHAAAGNAPPDASSSIVQQPFGDSSAIPGVVQQVNTSKREASNLAHLAQAAPVFPESPTAVDNQIKNERVTSTKRAIDFTDEQIAGPILEKQAADAAVAKKAADEAAAAKKAADEAAAKRAADEAAAAKKAADDAAAARQAEEAKQAEAAKKAEAAIQPDTAEAVSGSGVKVAGVTIVTPASGIRADLRTTAISKLGAPYASGPGAIGPNAFDCTGFTMWVYEQSHIQIPRTNQQDRGTRISTAQLRPGDIVVWGFGWNDVVHNGIYLGKDANGVDWVIHASTSGVIVSQMNSVLIDDNAGRLVTPPFAGGVRYVN